MTCIIFEMNSIQVINTFIFGLARVHTFRTCKSMREKCRNKYKRQGYVKVHELRWKKANEQYDNG